MFAEIIAALLGNLAGVAQEIDQSITEFRSDQNNTQKAQTVAKGVLNLVDTVMPIVSVVKTLRSAKK